MSLTVEFDVDAVQATLARLPIDLRDKGAQLAVNKTAAKAKTEMKRQIVAVYNLKSTEGGGALHTTPASLKKGIFTASLYPTSLSGSKKGRAMNVIHFLESKTTLADAKRRTSAGTLQQLFFQFKTVGGKKTIPAVNGKSAPFIGNQGRTVFRRTGKASLPIEPVQVVGMQQMFNTKALNEAVLRKSAADLLVETNRAVTLLLSQLK